MSEFLVRSFPTELAAADTDGRTIVGICVPYDVESEVSDPVERGGLGIAYREVWRAGAFRNVLKAPHMVKLVYEHEERSILNVVGHGVELVERSEGLEGTFRAVGAPGDQALELINAGTTRGLSIGVLMHERGSRGDPRHELVERVRVAKLLHVALTGTPAYAAAGVTAVRSGGDDVVDDELGTWLDWIAESRANSRRD